MKRKILPALLALVLVMGTMTFAFAANGLSPDGTKTDTQDVKGNYVAGTTSTVYSVDISWGAMEFTYTDANKGVWDPAEHKYKNQTAAAWTGDDGSNNKIEVTNHSNNGITAALAYAAEASYADATGTFGKNTLDCATADTGATTTQAGAATTDSTTLTMSGSLPSGTSNQKIGTITVTISGK